PEATLPLRQGSSAPRLPQIQLPKIKMKPNRSAALVTKCLRCGATLTCNTAAIGTPEPMCAACRAGQREAFWAACKTPPVVTATDLFRITEGRRRKYTAQRPRKQP